MGTPVEQLRPLTVAVTGGIGAGKSTVSRGLGDHGAVVVDSDRLAREVVAPGTGGLAAVVDAFGIEVLDADGALDRPALGAIVFGDPEARRRLEAITHPLVRALFTRRVAEAGPDALVVNDIPLLRTMQDAVRYHLVITVGMADEGARIGRLVARGHSESDARARIAAQIDDDARRALSDVWIDNSGTPAALQTGIDELHRRMVTFARNRSARAVAPDSRPAGSLPDGPLRHRILAAAPGGALDADGPLVVVGDHDRLTESLQDNGFAWFGSDPVGGTCGQIGNCDPGRPFSLPAVRRS
ncbi:MAG: dephospho-CoA kinase [Nakamurella sp.]